MLSQVNICRKKTVCIGFGTMHDLRNHWGCQNISAMDKRGVLYSLSKLICKFLALTFSGLHFPCEGSHVYKNYYVKYIFFPSINQSCQFNSQAQLETLKWYRRDCTSPILVSHLLSCLYQQCLAFHNVFYLRKIPFQTQFVSS